MKQKDLSFKIRRAYEIPPRKLYKTIFNSCLKDLTCTVFNLKKTNQELSEKYFETEKHRLELIDKHSKEIEKYKSEISYLRGLLREKNIIYKLWEKGKP